MYYLYVVHINI